MGLDGKRPGVEMGDEYYRGRVDKLTHKGRTVVSKPEVTPLRESFPEVKDVDINKLGQCIGNHRGHHGSKRQLANSIKDRAGVPGQYSTKPQKRHNPEIEAQSNPHNLVRTPPSVELTNEIGTQEGHGIRQNADGHNHGNRESNAGNREGEIDETGNSDNVEHGECAQKYAA